MKAQKPGGYSQRSWRSWRAPRQSALSGDSALVDRLPLPWPSPRCGWKIKIPEMEYDTLWPPKPTEMEYGLENMCPVCEFCAVSAPACPIMWARLC